jgi:proteasome lid subunit RPN8/RPN11
MAKQKKSEPDRQQKSEPDKPRIDYRDTPDAKAVSRAFPVSISQEYRVYISPDAYKRMKDHAATSDEVELCGVLVGDICKDDQGIYLSVTGAIEGEGANTYGTQVTFTQQTWDHIHEVRERDYPDAQIVGWFHTHPGFGVFLSGMDTFIQENFFNAPHQIAIVLETKAMQEGCFGWVDGKITALQRYWVGSREVRLVTGEAEPFEDDRKIRSATPDEPSYSAPQRELEPPPPAPFGMLSLAIIAAMCVALGVWWGYSLSRKSALEALQSEFYSMLEFAAINSAAAQDLQDVQTRVADVRDSLAKTGDAERTKELQNIEALLATYEKSYLKRDRATLRRQFSDLARTRKTLGERVDDANALNEELRSYVGDLYLLRVQEVLAALQATGVDTLPPQEAAMVRQLVDRLFVIDPRYKDVLKKMAPDLLRSLYPSASEKGKEKQEAKKDE